jgi:hypothetical protein
MKAPLFALAAAAACALSSARTADAANTFQFNQAGTGAPGTTIAGFNLSASNALAKGGNDAVNVGGVGSTFQLYVQGQIGNLIGPSGQVIAISPGQLTAVASITEVVTGINAATHVATFAVAPTQALGSGLALYANATQVANPSAGTGFITGGPILTATAITSPQGTLNNFQNNGGTVPFDQSPTPVGNPATPNSVNGSGVSTIDFSVTGTNNAYFPIGGPALIALHLGNAGANTPFTLVNPSLSFTSPSGVTVIPNLGTVNGDAPVANGGGGLGGPDIQFQVSGSVSGITAVPEPSSLCLMGLGLAGVFAVARRKAAKVAA